MAGLRESWPALGPQVQSSDRVIPPHLPQDVEVRQGGDACRNGRGRSQVLSPRLCMIPGTSHCLSGNMAEPPPGAGQRAEP